MLVLLFNLPNPDTRLKHISASAGKPIKSQVTSCVGYDDFAVFLLFLLVQPRNMLLGWNGNF